VVVTQPSVVLCWALCAPPLDTEVVRLAGRITVIPHCRDLFLELFEILSPRVQCRVLTPLLDLLQRSSVGVM
jgi:hypothetical protein